MNEAVETNLIGIHARQLETIRRAALAIIPSRPMAMADVHKALGENVKNLQQVQDVMKQMYNKGILGRIREGKSFLYWGKSEENWVSSTKAKPTDHHLANIPEIRVEQDRIVIIHAKCKIIVEFSL